MNIRETIEQALSSAGLGSNATTSKVREVIDRALSSAGLGAGTAPAGRTTAKHKGGAREPSPALPGRFEWLRHSGANGTRRYRLYVPDGHEGVSPRPLVVMLHGCKQNPDDFARGTRMNALAQQRGFLVAYPEQTSKANGSNCWNWFEPGHQGEGGEPGVIAGIVADIQRQHAVDPKRVFVAGLSAGAAMAVIAAQNHPGVFAAVAAHSGLPLGAAASVPDAFAAMQGRGAAAPRALSSAVRTLVIHGTADTTVAPSNGDRIVEQALAAFKRQGVELSVLAPFTTRQAGQQVAGTRFIDAAGEVQVEQWIVPGGAHAWFGGSPEGSFTQASGPDASGEIVRFFLGS